jgi:hypothetical protein
MDRVVTFYPASGLRNATSGAFANTGLVGYCWQSAVSVPNAYLLRFDSTTVSPPYVSNRAYGFSVRCVQNLQ